ncbi:hypothetical protein U1Q18_014943 [Sarracenia purpurea var. burkii]
MSKHAPLPPRCPFQKKITCPSPSSCKDTELYPRHQKSISQSSILEEQPAWLDDLLSDSDAGRKGLLHRRSASDSMTLLDGLVSLPSLDPLNDEDSSVSCETDGVLESACMYGPNSPRRKGKLSFPENAMVSALSEYLSQNPTQYLDSCHHVSGMLQCDSVQDASGSAGEANTETRAVKRHSGQRSRVRKLQYIAELERTVEIFQTLKSELAVRVASLLQQHATLSMENIKLKQQVARLKQEKLIVDSQYQSLKKELERLKNCLAHSSKGTVSTGFRTRSAAKGVISEAAWQMMDMGKLDLNQRN